MTYRIPTIGQNAREDEVFKRGIDVGMDFSAMLLAKSALQLSKRDPRRATLEQMADYLADAANGKWSQIGQRPARKRPRLGRTDWIFIGFLAALWLTNAAYLAWQVLTK